MDGKNGELASLKAKLNARSLEVPPTESDDPHDSWDAEAFRATLKEDQVNEPAVSVPEKEVKPDAVPAQAGSEKDKEWETGTVFSIKSQKELQGAAKQSALKKGSWDHFEGSDSKVSETDISNVDLSKFQTGGAATGKFLGEFKADNDTKSAEVASGFSEQEIGKMSDLEKAKPVSEAATFDKQLAHDVQNALDKEFPGTSAESKEQSRSPEQAALEKARTRWREWKEKSEAHDKKFNELLREHILKESKGWRYFANMPRRTFGLQPKPSKELEDMRGESQGLRWAYNDAAKELLKAKKDFIKPRMRTTGIAQAPEEYNNSDKVAERYRRMFSYHVTTGIHRKRVEAQREAVNEAWGESKVLRPVSEALAKHKKLIVPPMLLGATILNPIGVFAGLGVGLGAKKLLDKAYVESARKRLAGQQANIGENYFDRSFLEEDREMEKATALVSAREARAKTMATAAGIAAGMTATGYVNGLDTGSVNVTPGGPDSAPPDSFDSSDDLSEPKVADKTIDEAKVSAEKADAKPPVEAAGPDREPGVAPDPEAAEDHEDEIEGDEAGPVVIHQVESGDNLWNIMKSESTVLRDMSPAEQNHWQDKLWDYYEMNHEEAEELGVVKSHGDVHKIYPGEEINVTKLDEKLLELMHQNNAGEIPAPTPRPEVGEVVLPDQAPIPEPNPSNLPNEVQVPAARPEAVVLPSEAPIPQSNSVEVASLPDSAPVPETRPEMAMSETTPSVEAVSDDVAVQNYVQEVEKGKSSLLWGGRPDVAGTFDALKGMTFADIKAVATSPDLGAELDRLGLQPDGWNRWVDTINEQAKLIPANDDEQLGQYIARIVSGNRVA